MYINDLFNLKFLKHKIIQYAFNNNIIKIYINKIVFKTIIIIIRTLFMALACLFVKSKYSYVTFCFEIIICIIIQKITNLILPKLFIFENKTNKLTNFILTSITKPYFNFIFELFIYLNLFLITFFIELTNEKLRYIISQQIILCIYFELDLKYNQSYIFNHFDFEFIDKTDVIDYKFGDKRDYKKGVIECKFDENTGINIYKNNENTCTHDYKFDNIKTECVNDINVKHLSNKSNKLISNLYKDNTNVNISKCSDQESYFFLELHNQNDISTYLKIKNNYF